MKLTVDGRPRAHGLNSAIRFLTPMRYEKGIKSFLHIAYVTCSANIVSFVYRQPHL